MTDLDRAITLTALFVSLVVGYLWHVDRSGLRAQLKGVSMERDAALAVVRVQKRGAR